MRLFYKSLNLNKHKLLLAACLGLMGVSDANAQITVQLGGITTASTAFPRPYPENFTAARQQYLFTAAELKAAGLYAGNITKIGFYNAANGVAALEGYTIYMGNVTATSLNNSTWETPDPNAVFSAATISVNASSWNTHTLNGLGYHWDGTSNLLVELCQTNTSTATNPTTAIMNTSFNSTHSTAQATGGTGCGSTSLAVTGTQTQRPSVQFTLIPDCLPPSNIVTSNITATSATVNWTPSPNFGTNAFKNYQWMIDQNFAAPVPTGPAPTPWNSSQINAPLPQPSPLTPETKYYVHVRTECDEANRFSTMRTSEWILDSFMTIPDCTRPIVTVDRISHTDAIVSWPPVPTAYDYEYAVAVYPAAPPTKGTRTQSTVIHIPGLMAKTMYTVYVRAYCEPTPRSIWGESTFETLITTGIEDGDNSGFYVAAYPTPARDMVTIEVANGAATGNIQVADLSGRHMRAMNVANGKTNLDMSSFAPGIYIIKYTDDARSKTIKIVKE